MTTSYELSLKLKELGVEQEGGEYYWVLRQGFRWNVELAKGEYYDDFKVKHRSELVDPFNKYTPLCRALTLGELVRMMPEISIIKLSGDKYGATCVIFSIDKNTQFSTSPEEAAGELLAELKQKEVSNG